MKQKRKLKSLIPQDRKVSFLATMLFILGLLLCIGSVSLWTTPPVGAVAPNPNILSYTGLDDRVEVLYRLELADPSDLSGKVVSNFYVSGSSLYISPSPLIVNSLMSDPNQIAIGVYSNILGGYGNVITGNNITIIGGSHNTIGEKNDNATMLGGINGSMKVGTEGGVPSVMIGGENNKIGDNHEGVVILGGSKNIIGEDVKNSFILGGENNTIEEEHINVIIGGKGVTGDVDNVFVFSDSTFKPVMSGAFYLNMSNGVGFGTGAITGLAVGGAVRFGEIDISKDCSGSLLGLVGSWSGCLIGCTQISYENHSKWELLDRGENCERICNNNDRCFYKPSQDVETPNYDYVSFCINNVNTGNATMCTPVLDHYKNVVFESSLIDSDDECPDIDDDKENRCIFKCNSGYHLTGDLAGNNIKCYKDCDWHGTSLKHNETTIAYNVHTVACSNDNYIFPKDTSIINFPTNSYPNTKTISGKTKISGGTSFESCTNDDHQKILVCNNGTLYLAKSDGKTASNIKASKYGYTGDTCSLESYTCQTTTYNLSIGYIKNTIVDTTDGRNKVDRGINTGTRGVYKLCIDRSPESSTNSTCTRGSETEGYHYQLLKCRAGYTTGESHPYECRHTCEVDGKKIVNNQTGTWYAQDNTICPQECPSISKIFKCIDGDLLPSDAEGNLIEAAGYTINNYPKASCNPTKVNCGGYNVTETIMNQRSGQSIYDSCVQYSVNGQQCVKGNNKYKLVGCKEGYHSYSGGKYCKDNIEYQQCVIPVHSHYIREYSNYTNYNRAHVFGSQNGHKGYYLRQWACGWDKEELSCWSDVNKEQACAWKCDTEYYEKDGNCINDGICKNDEPNGCQYGANTTTHESRDGFGNFYWRCEGDGGTISKDCHHCANNHTYIPNEDEPDKGKCMRDTHGQCGTTKYQCEKGLLSSRSDTKENRYTWSCKAIGEGYNDTGYNDTDYENGKGICFSCKTELGYYLNPATNKCEKKYTVTYDYNGCANYPNEETSYFANDSVVLLSKEGQNGWQMKGWNTDKNATINLSSYKMPASNVTLYAICHKDSITYTATFYKNGAISQTNSAGAFVITDPVIRECIIPEVYNGATQATTCSITSPNIRPVNGFTVLGYDSTSTSTISSLNTGTLKDINSNVTYYAITKKDVSVTFKPNGNKLDGGIVDISKTCTRYNGAGTCTVKTPEITSSGNNTPIVVGYTLTSEGINGEVEPSNDNISITGGEIYYAHTKNTPKTYTVTFYKNKATSQRLRGETLRSGGNSVSTGCTINPTYDGVAQKVNCAVYSPYISVNNGWYGLGYNTSSNATSSTWSQNTRKSISSNMEYYAITTKDAIKYTATFNKNSAQSIGATSGSCIIATGYNGNQGTECSVVAPTVNLNQGYSFIGFNTGSDATTNNSSYNTSTNKLTLTTMNNNHTWYVITKKNQYTVTITSNNTNYGTVSQSLVTGYYGDSISENGNKITIGTKTVTATPTSSIYKFNRWDRSDCGEELVQNCTIQAVFSIDANNSCSCFGVWTGVGGKCISYLSSSACTCTPIISTCEAGGWNINPQYQTCTSGVGCPTAAYLRSGINFRKALNELANGYDDTFNANNITAIIRSGSMPGAATNKQEISTTSSPAKVWAWYENGIIYYYTNVNKIYLHPDSSRMFAYFHDLTSIDMSGWDTSNVTDMSKMFLDCYSLTILNLSNWDTSSVTGMNSMFGFASGLVALDVSNWDTSKVTDMGEMFYDLRNLTSLNLQNWNTERVKNMEAMFGSCDKLGVIYVSSGFNVDNVETSTDMFFGCYRLYGGSCTSYYANYNQYHWHNEVDYAGKTYAHIDGLGRKPGYFTNYLSAPCPCSIDPYSDECSPY